MTKKCQLVDDFSDNQFRIADRILTYNLTCNEIENDLKITIVIIIMRFTCENCSFESDDASNYQRHLNSKKHEKKCIEIETEKKNLLRCTNCNRQFNHTSNLARHQKFCMANIIKEMKIDHQNEVKELKNKITVLEDKLIMMTNHYDYLKSLVNNAGSMVKISVNALSYAVQNFNNAPAIVSFNNFALLQTEEKYTIVEIAIYNHKNGKLPSYIGHAITSEYKKKDPREQSIWNTDTSRFSYIIRECINEKLEWVIDKGGLKFTDVSIGPILDYLKNLLNKHLADRSKLFLRKDTNVISLQSELNVVNDILNKIADNSLAIETIKYITSSFYLNKTKMIKGTPNILSKKDKKEARLEDKKEANLEDKNSLDNNNEVLGENEVFEDNDDLEDNNEEIEDPFEAFEENDSLDTNENLNELDIIDKMEPLVE